MLIEQLQQLRVKRLCEELAFALSRTDGAVLRGWSGRAAGRLFHLGARRVGGLAQLASGLARFGGKEAGGFYRALRGFRFGVHAGQRSANAIDGALTLGSESGRFLTDTRSHNEQPGIGSLMVCRRQRNEPAPMYGKKQGRWRNRLLTACEGNQSRAESDRLSIGTAAVKPVLKFSGGFMQPKIVNAQRRISFGLAEGYLASLYGDIESAGIIQYHHLLVIYGPGKEPCLFFGSEWSGLDPSYKDKPVLGSFDEVGHSNYGESLNWLDDALFVLKAFELAREILHIEDSGMAEGEAWAMAEILKKIQQPSDDETLVRHRTGYEEALRRNDGRMVDYMILKTAFDTEITEKITENTEGYVKNRDSPIG